MTTEHIKAIQLQPGDECVGPVIFADRGVVHHTTVIDAGVQITWRGPDPHRNVGDTITVRPEDYQFVVKREVLS